MGWIAGLLYAFVFLLAPICDSLIQITLQIKTLARIDRDLGETADIMSTNINAALNLNGALLRLYAACPAAASTGQLAPLAAQAIGIAETQRGYLIAAGITTVRLGPSYLQQLNLPVRLARGPCALPGLLRCRGPEIFLLRHISDDSPGGALGRSRMCREVRWSYEDRRVQPL